ncbi:MAG: helical backbone metal receptor [Acidobacteriota bacterium]|nr:helical backbone metal receptor [Acidobacteriota bacterium]
MKTADHRPQAAGVALLLTVVCLHAACAPTSQPASATPQRIVTLIPAVTETLFAVGAGAKVVGVSAFDTYPPEVNAVARVGGLIDPDTERILSLKPDLVFLYGSQHELITQMQRAGIAVETYRHGGVAGIIEATRAVGARVGHAAEGAALADSIAGAMDDVRRRVAGAPRPATLIVFGREDGTLRGIYASGGVGFIHDMVDAAGGRNIFADVKRESVQASLESILERAPEIILELRAPVVGRAEGWTARQVAIWNGAPSLPAVRNRRVHVLLDERLVVPGPRVAGGIELLARTIHQ